MAERKHLKLECQKVFGELVAVRVVEQTHRNEAFGSSSNNRNEAFGSSSNKMFVATNGYVLRSDSCPAWDGGVPQTVYLRGYKNGWDNSIFYVPLADFDKIAFAVREYNKTFSGEETTVVTDTGTFFVE